MFPSLSDIVAYFFHIRVRIPIQTLGFFIALSFVLTYLAFVSEFKRKEKQGLIHPFKTKVLIGAPASVTELIVNAFLGFVLGYKVIGALFNYEAFINDPKDFLFSVSGNLIAGLLCAAGWAFWAWYSRKKDQLPKPEIIEKTVHPYQLMVSITFWAGIIGFIGAKLFDVVEHLPAFWNNPFGMLFSSNGFTYYGGFIFGMLTYFYIGVKHGIKLAHVADMGAPGIMLAYGVGRIGCQLSGDGDWGIVNVHPKPIWLHWLPDWMWSFNFPHNVINVGNYINGCRGQFCSVLPQGVYPTSFYESVICILLFAFMWAIRKNVNTAGFMSFFCLILMGTERFLIEIIKINIKYKVMGLYLTQAQVIGILEILVGIGGLIYIYRGKTKRLFFLSRV